MPDGVGHRLHHSGDWSYHDPSDWDIYRAERIAIGIRLGQRWCSVSCIEDGVVKDLIIKVPSLVTFTKNQTYYGAEAIRHSISNISNCVYEFFGLLGRKYDDRWVQQFTKHITYSLIQIDRDKHPQIPKYSIINEDIGIPVRFSDHSQPHIFTVIEIVAQFLEYLVREAEDKVGCPIAHVAISVPNTFGQCQRLALMQAAKEVNIEPLRLVTSCMAASVCVRYFEMHRTLDEQATENNGNSNNSNNNSTANGNRGDTKYDDDDDYSQHTSHLNHEEYKNGYHDHHHHHDQGHDVVSNGYSDNGNTTTTTTTTSTKTKKKRKKKSNKTRVSLTQSNNDKCYLIADLSNLACSVSIIECKQKRHCNLIKVHHCAGNINDGIWKMINAFSLYVVRSFVDGYKGYYRPNLQQKTKATKTKKKKKKNGYGSHSKYKFQNDILVYDELRQIDEIEKHDDDDDDDGDGDDHGGGDDSNCEHKHSHNYEALKCRFRSQMLCDTIIEHLHDQYVNEEVQIHYEQFFRAFSLQLILTAKKMSEIALNPFLFNMTNCIDKILQEYSMEHRERNNTLHGHRHGHNNNNKSAAPAFPSIDECILIGDGGNIPDVVHLFSEYFNLNQEFDAQPIVSRGCAIVAAVDQELIPSPISLDLLPHSIRMEDATNNEQNENTLIIAAQNPCPCKKTITRYTYVNHQTLYRLQFYEGESNNNKLCRLIGKFEIRDIIKRPKRETKIVVAIHVDRNCIMFVSAEDVTSKPPQQLNVVRLEH